MDATNPDHVRIQTCLRHVLEIQTIIENGGRDLFLAPADASTLQTRVHGFLTLYTELGHSADAAGLFLWNITPKFHFFWHFAQRAQYLSPRRGSCFIDEDYVGQMKTVGQACSHGTQLHDIPGKLVEKVRCAKGLE